MTASAFSYSWAKLSGELILLVKKWTRIGTFKWMNPLRSPMSIFSKSLSGDLEKCEAGQRA